MTQPIRRILVPTDFSERAAAALDYARAMARELGAAVHVLHVLDDSMAADAAATWTSRADAPSSRTARLDGARERLAQAVADASEAIFGDVAATITDYAKQIDADLIVIGTHGRTGITHLLAGSIAERVMRTAPCSVITVRTPPAHPVGPGFRLRKGDGGQVSRTEPDGPTVSSSG